MYDVQIFSKHNVGAFLCVMLPCFAFFALDYQGYFCSLSIAQDTLPQIHDYAQLSFNGVFDSTQSAKYRAHFTDTATKVTMMGSCFGQSWQIITCMVPVLTPGASISLSLFRYNTTTSVRMSSAALTNTPTPVGGVAIQYWPINAVAAIGFSYPTLLRVKPLPPPPARPISYWVYLAIAVAVLLVALCSWPFIKNALRVHKENLNTPMLVVEREPYTSLS